MNDTTTSTAIAPAAAGAPPATRKARLEADGQGVMAIVPRNLEEAMRYATGMATSGIVPDAFRFDGKRSSDVNTSLVAMGVLKVMEIGLAPQTGLGFLLPLNGRFSIWGDGAVALVQSKGAVADQVVEWHYPEGFHPDTTTLPLDKWPRDFAVTVKYWRVGQVKPYVGEYSVGRAMRAGLWNNSYKKPWITDPARMIFNRARAYALRDGFSDFLCGLGIVEEVRDYTVPAKPQATDNSALDDDLPSLPAPSDASDIGAQLDAYIAGLPMVATLADLIEWQQQPNNAALAAELQRTDETAHARMIAANAKRYSEIESGARHAEEAASDAERRDAADKLL